MKPSMFQVNFSFQFGKRHFVKHRLAYVSHSETSEQSCYYPALVAGAEGPCSLLVDSSQRLIGVQKKACFVFLFSLPISMTYKN